jgi:hypothetical protein
MRAVWSEVLRRLREVATVVGSWKSLDQVAGNLRLFLFINAAWTATCSAQRGHGLDGLLRATALVGATPCGHLRHDSRAPAARRGGPIEPQDEQTRGRQSLLRYGSAASRASSVCGGADQGSARRPHCCGSTTRGTRGSGGRVSHISWAWTMGISFTLIRFRNRARVCPIPVADGARIPCSSSW